MARSSDYCAVRGVALAVLELPRGCYFRGRYGMPTAAVSGTRRGMAIPPVAQACLLSSNLRSRATKVRVRAGPWSRKLAVDSVVWQPDRARNDRIELLLRHLYLIKYGVA